MRQRIFVQSGYLIGTNLGNPFMQSGTPSPVGSKIIIEVVITPVKAPVKVELWFGYINKGNEFIGLAGPYPHMFDDCTSFKELTATIDVDPAMVRIGSYVKVVSTSGNPQIEPNGSVVMTTTGSYYPDLPKGGTA